MSSDSASNLQTRIQMAQNMKEEEKQYRYNGVLYPTIMCPEENLKVLNQFQARSDDILLVAYPKCGEWIMFMIEIVKEFNGNFMVFI